MSAKKDDKSHMNAVVAIEQIDGKKAGQYLAQLMEGQRHLREGHVVRLATEMEQGNWRLSSDALLLIRGKLANGQHRLQAVTLIDKAMPFLVMRSNDEALYKVLDCGIARTTGDALGNVAYAREMAAVARLVCFYDAKALTLTGRNCDRTNKITRSQIIDYIEEHSAALAKEISEVVSLNSKRRLLAPIIGAAMLHICNRKGGDNGLTFIRNVYIGGSADAAFDLREKLIRNASSKAKLHREYIFALLIKAYRSFIQGTRPGVLRVSDGEAFPVLP